jgi:aminopeptidase N
MANPNRVRSVVGSFALNNPTQFNRPDGVGYDLVAGIVLELDSSNPQVAARLLTAFGSWRMMDAARRARAEAALRRIAERTSLSPDVADIVRRSLA